MEIICIQVRKNEQSRPHYDGNNLGPSLAAAFGQFKGGGLWTVCADGPKRHQLKEDVKKHSCLRHSKDDIVRGRTHHLQQPLNAPCLFNGNALHFTLPFTGERFVVIYFTHKRRYDKTPGHVRAFLSGLGFCLSFFRTFGLSFKRSISLR